MTKAAAAIFLGPDQPLAIEEIEVDNPAPNEVLIRTAACGVCHSDLHYMQGSIVGPRPPVVPGHEPAGVVEAVGSDVQGVAVGDHVVACTSMFCGSCTQCLRGHSHLCTNRSFCMRPKGAPPRLTLGGEAIRQFADLSGFAELMLVHERAVVKIPDDIPLDRAALVGCAVTTGVGAALNTAQVAAGSSVAVFGCGGVGTSVIQGARLAGARQIIAIDRLPAKLENALHFGATDTILPGEESVVRQIKKLSGGGVDYAFDAVGLPELAASCLYALAPRGLAVIVGAIARGQKLELEPGHFYVEKRLTGSLMGSSTFHIDTPRYLELYRQGKLDLDAMIDARLPLSGINDAMETLEAGTVTRSVICF
ncbi:MAG: Zn-dependent alcohol dehydrogenase [Actinomycetia bacterium]|nr:Zn-dependent alcohol dehydrogenase [Actinomycetes bacterium]